MKKIFSIAASLLLCATIFAVPRPEYPRPQFERENWVNLNGEWNFILDLASTGWDRQLMDYRNWDKPNGNSAAWSTAKDWLANTGLKGKITVPFAPETKLSGVEYTEFIPSIWYERTIEIPAGWTGKDIILNFGAVYYTSEIYIDGKFVARHFGGSDSFSLDITKFVSPGGTHSLVVNAVSDLRSRAQSAGKQSLREGNFECMYTRTTGIWQTVWMEAVHPAGLSRVRITPDIDRSQVSFQVFPRNNVSDCSLSISIYFKGKLVAKDKGRFATGSLFTVPIKKAALWSPETPNLYDVVLEVVNSDGVVMDKVASYFGMRKIHCERNLVYLNNEPYYQRLVLDQGFYPDGIWTAPTDNDLRNDIQLAKSVGFNGARLHQKVFEERFHYWADHLGYIIWGEAPSWGMDCNEIESARNFISEWSNIVERDINHPSIAIWTPFNEEFWPDETQYPRFIADIYDITKNIDPTRPINTVSGGTHIKTDIWTFHEYEQDPGMLKSKLFKDGKLEDGTSPLADRAQHRPWGNIGFNRPILSSPYDFPTYDGEIPYILDEFGGIRCMETNPDSNNAWGYGSAPQTVEQFYERLEGQVRAIMDLAPNIWGFCFTQLTDLQQEQNGVFYFDRSLKYDSERLKAIFQMKPAEN